MTCKADATSGESLICAYEVVLCVQACRQRHAVTLVEQITEFNELRFGSVIIGLSLPPFF